MDLKQMIIDEYEESPASLPNNEELSQIVLAIGDPVNDVTQEFNLSEPDIVAIIDLAFEHINAGLVKLTKDNVVTGITEMIRYAAAETAVDYVVRTSKDYGIRYEDFSLRFDEDHVVIQYYCGHEEQHEYLASRLGDLTDIDYEDDYFGYMAG